MEDTDRPIQARGRAVTSRRSHLSKPFRKELATSAVTDCLRRRFCEQTTGQPIESIPLALEAQEHAAIHCIGATVQCLQELQEPATRFAEERGSRLASKRALSNSSLPVQARQTGEMLPQSSEDLQSIGCEDSPPPRSGWAPEGPQQNRRS